MERQNQIILQHLSSLQFLPPHYLYSHHPWYNSENTGRSGFDSMQISTPNRTRSCRPLSILKTPMMPNSVSDSSPMTDDQQISTQFNGM